MLANPLPMLVLVNVILKQFWYRLPPDMFICFNQTLGLSTIGGMTTW